jgi:hypothetical protein
LYCIESIFFTKTHFVNFVLYELLKKTTKFLV